MLYILLDYIKASTRPAFDLLRVFQILTTDPTVFSVPIKFFKEMTEVSGLEYIFMKLTMTCAMYGANRDLQKKEVKLAGVRGKVQPVVITSQTLKIAKALDQN